MLGFSLNVLSDFLLIIVLEWHFVPLVLASFYSVVNKHQKPWLLLTLVEGTQGSDGLWIHKRSPCLWHIGTRQNRTFIANSMMTEIHTLDRENVFSFTMDDSCKGTLCSVMTSASVCEDEWVLIATCKQLVWSTWMTIWILAWQRFDVWFLQWPPRP